MTSVEPTKEETSYTLAEPVAVGGGGKQGHKCCGGCCDMRRAVIIVNIVHASIIGLAFLGVLASRNLDYASIYDDDSVASAMSEAQNKPIGMAVSVLLAQIVAALCGIAGGMKFNIPLTAIAATGYIAFFIIGLIGFNPFALLYHGFFLYPHVFFIQEIQKGIMTEANYPIEKQSCCCV